MVILTVSQFTCNFRLHTHESNALYRLHMIHKLPFLRKKNWKLGIFCNFSDDLVYMKKSGQNLSQMGTTIVIPICYLFILQAS
jgi:hypothetical protein